MNVESVTAYVRPYDYWYDRYQKYYRHGLRSKCLAMGVSFREVSMTRAPGLLRPVRYVRDRFLVRFPGTWVTSGVDRVAATVEGPIHSPSSSFHNGVGQYVIQLAGGATCNVCIDSADYPVLRSDELVSWSDLYFKANMWPLETYPDHVVPIVNGDPLILKRIPALKSYRTFPQEVDLGCIIRVWGGRDGLEGIEHNLQLLEAISRVRCSKTVIAYVVTGDIEAISRRLRRSGIHLTTRAIRPKTLWRLMASARLNVIRLGMHDCIPWRVAGALAMGTCIVLDQRPRAAWPAPLREGVNYLNLGCDKDDSATSDRSYGGIPAKIETWLTCDGLLENIRSANAEYFDWYVEPERVGEHILASVENRT